MTKVMDVLHKVALQGQAIRGSKHACAITYKKNILSIGTNQLKTHPMMLKYQKNENAIFLHAEIDAIVRTINNHGTEILRKCDLHVMRLTQGNKIGESCPCSGCQEAIDFFKIRKVFHS